MEQLTNFFALIVDVWYMDDRRLGISKKQFTLGVSVYVD